MNLQLASVYVSLIVMWLILKHWYVTSKQITCSLLKQTKRICKNIVLVCINFKHKNLSRLDQV